MCLSKLRHSLDHVAGFIVQRITPVEIGGSSHLGGIARMFSGGRLNQPETCSYNEDICYPEKEDRESTILYIYTIIYNYIYNL